MDDSFQYLSSLSEYYLSFDADTRNKAINTFIAFGIIFIVKRLLSFYIFKKIENYSTRYKTQKIINIITNVILVLIVGRIWSKSIGSLATVLGLITAGLAVALKDLVINIAGFLFILWKKPFELGNRIQYGEHKGDVIDIRLFQFSMLEIGHWVGDDQSTGRVIHIPNGGIFTQPLVNFAQGFNHIWDELDILVTFESDWKKAKTILETIITKEEYRISNLIKRRLRESSKKFMIYFNNLDPIVYTSVKDSGISLTLRYLCKPKKRRDNRQMLWEEILVEFEKNKNIDFAYPTHRLFNNRLEGKLADKTV